MRLFSIIVYLFCIHVISNFAFSIRHQGKQVPISQSSLSKSHILSEQIIPNNGNSFEKEYLNHVDNYHKTQGTLPKIINLLDQVSFHWVSSLINKGNERPLELNDVWTLPKHEQMHVISRNYYHNLKLDNSTYCPDSPQHLLSEYWNSKVTKTLITMYKNEFILSGVLKGLNTVVQFLPSLIISKILQPNVGPMQPLPFFPDFINQDLPRFYKFFLAFVLFGSLMAKTFIENQYFDISTNLGLRVRSTLSSAIYQKALDLGPRAMKNMTIGEIVNYMQLDAARLELVAANINTVWDGFFQILGYTCLLLYFLGPSVLAGFTAMLFILPLNAYLLNRLSRFREKNMKYTDKRVKLTNELLQGIQAIKSYNWENPFGDRLYNLRNSELYWLKIAANSRAILISALNAAPSFVAVFTLAAYAGLGNKVEPTKVFTALALFNQLRFPLTFLPLLLNTLIEGRVSLKRISNYFDSKDIESYIDTTFNVTSSINFPPMNTNEIAIQMTNATFSWGIAPQNNQTSRGILKDINIRIKQGELVAIVGPTGSGKSTLISSLLQEVCKDHGSVYLNGSVSYVPQASWIPNMSVKEAILFGKAFDKDRYDKVVEVSGLSKDFELFQAGDETELGERGVNLSGGQKQRISIARAVYSDSDIYLFDDPLSALDNEVGIKVFQFCIKDYLKGKTRLLVTHKLSTLAEADRIILMDDIDETGYCRILDEGTLVDLVTRGHDLTSFVKEPETIATPTQDKDQTDSILSNKDHYDGEFEQSQEKEPYNTVLSESFKEDTIPSDPESKIELVASNLPPTGAIFSFDSNKQDSSVIITEDPPYIHQNKTSQINLSDNTISSIAELNQTSVISEEDISMITSKHTNNKGSLIKSEVKKKGEVDLKIYLDYISEAKKPWILGIIVISYLLANTSQIMQQWFVADWTSDFTYKKRSLQAHLGLVSFMAICVASFTWLRTFLSVVVGAESSKALHNKMIQSILQAPLNYFESTPIGRLLQSFSKDLDQIDHSLPNSMSQLIASTLQIAASLFAICLVTPSFGILMSIILGMYIQITSRYRPVVRELKRIDSLTRSPIYSHFSETISGLPVIRCFKRQKDFEQRCFGKIDDNRATLFSIKKVDRWLSTRLEMLGNLLVLASAFLAIRTSSTAGSTGLSLTNALGVTSLLNWAVRNAADAETLMNNVERVYQLIRDTPKEPPKEITNFPAGAFVEAAGEKPAIANEIELDVEKVPLPSSDLELLQSRWPWEGDIQFSDVYMKYQHGFDPVLRGVNFRILPGERLGVVGRTGSGKSSLFRGLLRLNELESGRITIDGVNISLIGLNALRSSISVIPQEPILFSGSIRMNLDPMRKEEDNSLWRALRKVHLENMIRNFPGGLDFEISNGGDNLSSGQRQLLCLARALVRKSRIILLDEATSSIDYEMDKLIQKTIREEFGTGSTTVITIAHRLSSIIDADKILVMGEGVVQEFDSPANLRKNPQSLFAKLLAAEDSSR